MSIEADYKGKSVMASEEKEFAHESLQDRESIVRYLNALGEGFEQGKLLLASNSTKCVMDTPGLMRFDVRAKQKRDSAQIVLKISWKKNKGKTLHVEPLVIEGADAEA
jgi:amphi-Trp domain-containing protein